MRNINGASGLKTNSNEVKVIILSIHRTIAICINEQNIGGVERFVYLGSVTPAELAVAPRINNPFHCFVQNLKMHLFQHEHQVEVIRHRKCDSLLLNPIWSHWMNSTQKVS